MPYGVRVSRGGCNWCYWLSYFIDVDDGQHTIPIVPPTFPYNDKESALKALQLYRKTIDEGYDKTMFAKLVECTFTDIETL